MDGALFQAFGEVFGRGDVWLIVLAAAVYGIFVGAVPGLTATMAVALFVPMAYWLDPVAAMAAIVTMTACAIFSGDLPTVLLRIPGTPASAAYADEAHAFTLRGEGERVLGLALLCSALGGAIGAVVLMSLGGRLARMAAWFSVTEYFWLYLIGLTCAVLVASGPKSRAALSLMIGLFFSTIGLSAAHQEPRFTLGMPALFQGISFIPAMIGLFGLSEVLGNLARPPATRLEESVPARPGFLAAIRQMLADTGSRLRRRKKAVARSSAIGVLIGMLPGAGADIAAWISYAASKRSRRGATGSCLPGQEPQGDREALDEIGDATTANNAALAGSWIPALVFGIPGDSITAIVIGVLMMKNVTPGPRIFEEQTALVYSIYLVFLLANLVLIPVGFLAIRLGGRIVRFPKPVLFPLIVVFCVTGSYALNGSLFDVLTMLFMGVLGFFLTGHGLPLGPVVLGILLGGPLEERFIQALDGSGGNPLGLVARPLSMALALVFLALILAMARRRPGRGLRSRE